MILGLLVGITMGFELGTVDNVYLSVGVTLVGVILVGRIVEKTLGTTLGMEEGATDEALLGMTVGGALGAVLGMDVGASDDRIVGGVLK